MRIKLKLILCICLFLISRIGFCVPSAVEQIKAMPGLVALWVFDEPAGENRVSEGVIPYELVEMNGTHDWNKPIFGVSTGSVDRAEEGPLSGYSAGFDAGQYLMLSNNVTGDLNIHGTNSQVSVVAYIKRAPRYKYQPMQFIAGMWDERVGARQYGLILDVPVGLSPRGLVYPHVSLSGRGDPNAGGICIDFAANVTPVPYGEWQCVGMTYDGTHSRSYLNGVFEPRPDGAYYGGAANPYYFPDGFGDNGADFTVAGHGVWGPGMYGTFVGKIGGVAVFNRALAEEEMLYLYEVGDYRKPPVLVSDTFYNGVSSRLSMDSIGWMCSIGSNGVDASSSTVDWWIPLASGNGGDSGYAAKTSLNTRGFIWRPAPANLETSDLHSFRFALHNYSDEDHIRLAVQIEGQWYVGNQSLSMAGMWSSASDWRLTENKEFCWNSMAASWSILEYDPGIVLEVGDVLSGTNHLQGTINAYGIYNEPNIGTLRVDDFSIHNLETIGKPSIHLNSVDSNGSEALQISLSIDTLKGWSYQLQESANLIDWVNIAPEEAGNGVTNNFSAEGVGTNSFYRFNVEKSD